MFRKYEKTLRINTGTIKVSGKFAMSHDDVRRLLIGSVMIEEKIDGANVGIIGGKKSNIFRLQKRGSLVDTSEHPQFGRFKAWSTEHYNDLIKIKYPYIVYGEFMWATHHIFYDQLPDWFICFDIWDGTKYVDRTTKEKLCKELNLQVVPLLYGGYIESVDNLDKFVNGISMFSSTSQREGIQVKNYRKQMRGKIVRPEFIKEVDEDGSHWRSHWSPEKVNKLR